MPNIALLDQSTIDKIAAGEVIERPASVVKELVENAIDAKATAVTIEIKDGGISFIRITDNGCGIPKEEAALAFLRHSTSKIKSVEDLLSVTSLGFRGEALSSIAAVSQVELITKTKESLMGIKYNIEGGAESGIEDIGAPEGTTFLVRKLFFNVPARRKFLKTPATEAGYISDLVERLAVSHPDISFKFINNNQTKVHTSGNSNLKDIIYNIYGRDIASNLIEIDEVMEGVTVTGYIGKPIISRGNRNYENYFVNGRYVKSSVVARAIEEGYKTFMMQHKYPFTALFFEIDGRLLDVNVHPTKMELRFSNSQQIYEFICRIIRKGLSKRELIPNVSVGAEDNKEDKTKRAVPVTPAVAPEPFEKSRLDAGNKKPEYKPLSKIDMMFKEAEIKYGAKTLKESDESDRLAKPEADTAKALENTVKEPEVKKESAYENGLKSIDKGKTIEKEAAQQLDLFEEKLLTKEARTEHKIIGQVFDTYWLVQFKDNLYIIDQHAAHEKVLYERTIKSLKNKEYTSQIISPPIILTLSMQEEELLNRYMDNFKRVGFEIEPFGGKEYSVRAVPDNLFSIAQKELLIEMIDSLSDNAGKATPDIIDEKIASMSCKAAVKGNNRLSLLEAETLINELLTLDNPYNCPHGRPTIIAMSRYELEKKFKRIV